MMTTRRYLPLCLLLFCLLQFVTAGCDSTPDQPSTTQLPKAANSQPKNGERLTSENELKTAQQQASTAKQKLDESEGKVQAANQKYETLKKQADTLSEASVKSNKATSVNDPKLDDRRLSPNTAPARKKAVDALAELKQLTAERDSAAQIYQDAQAKVEQARAHLAEVGDSDINGEGWSLAQLLSILPPLVFLLLLAFLAFLFWRRVNVIDQRIAESQVAIINRQSDLGQIVGTIVESVAKMREQVQGLQISLTQLGLSADKAAALAAKGTQHEGTGSYDPSTATAYLDKIAEKEDLADFPASVSEYFKHEHGFITPLKHDRIKGMLVKDAEGPLMLVEGTGGYKGGLLAIPRMTRFKTVQDYNNHFEKYYDCYKPSSGEVVIDTPASVIQVDGGWELASRGMLEIR